MKSLPVELIFVLLFGLALLFNILKQLAARKQRAQAAKAVSEPDKPPMAEDVWRELVDAERRERAPEVSAPRRTEAPRVPPVRRRRRFARQTLLGTRREVQDAFVVATILGPCRGDAPHEIR